MAYTTGDGTRMVWNKTTKKYVRDKNQPRVISTSKPTQSKSKDVVYITKKEPKTTTTTKTNPAEQSQQAIEGRQFQSDYDNYMKNVRDITSKGDYRAEDVSMNRKGDVTFTQRSSGQSSKSSAKPSDLPGIYEPSQIVRGASTKLKREQPDNFNAQAFTASVTPGTTVYTQDDKVVAFFEPTTQRLVSRKGFVDPTIKPSYEEPLEDNFLEDSARLRVRFGADKGQPIEVGRENVMKLKSSGIAKIESIQLPEKGLLAKQEAGFSLLDIGKTKDELPAPRYNVFSSVARGGLEMGKAIAIEYVSAPGKTLKKDVALVGVGYGAGLVVKGGSRLVAPIVTKLSSKASPVLKVLGRGVVKGSKIGLGTTIVGVAGIEIATAPKPMQRAGVIAKDFALFGAGYSFGGKVGTKVFSEPLGKKAMGVKSGKSPKTKATRRQESAGYFKAQQLKVTQSKTDIIMRGDKAIRQSYNVKDVQLRIGKESAFIRPKEQPFSAELRFVSKRTDPYKIVEVGGQRFLGAGKSRTIPSRKAFRDPQGGSQSLSQYRQNQKITNIATATSKDSSIMVLQGVQSRQVGVIKITQRGLVKRPSSPVEKSLNIKQLKTSVVDKSKPLQSMQVVDVKATTMTTNVKVMGGFRSGQKEKIMSRLYAKQEQITYMRTSQALPSYKIGQSSFTDSKLGESLASGMFKRRKWLPQLYEAGGDVSVVRMQEYAVMRGFQSGQVGQSGGRVIDLIKYGRSRYGLVAPTKVVEPVGRLATRSDLRGVVIPQSLLLQERALLSVQELRAEQVPRQSIYPLTGQVLVNELVLEQSQAQSQSLVQDTSLVSSTISRSLTGGGGGGGSGRTPRTPNPIIPVTPSPPNIIPPRRVPPRRVPPKPPTIKIPGLTMRLPKLTQQKGFFVRERKLGNVFGGVYSPSVTAVALNIRGRKPRKELYETGLFLRPITGGI